MSYKPDYKYVPPLELHALTRIYDFALLLVGFGKKFRKKIINAVEIKDTYNILDVGCGTGTFLEILKQKHPNISVVGIDPDKQALSIASEKLKKYQNVKLINTFAEANTFSDESFDIVFSTLAFHHMPSEIKEKALKEIYRVLKKGGQLIIADFGKSKHPWIYRIVTFWEPFEYLEGNLKGQLPVFMERAGFINIREDSFKFPVIHLLIGKK